MSGYVLSADADLDLDEIWEYIAADNIDAADRWIGKLFDAFEALGQTPGMGHRRADLTAYPVLFWPVGAYLIIYLAERRPIRDRCRYPGLTGHPCLPEPARPSLRQHMKTSLILWFSSTRSRQRNKMSSVKLRQRATGYKSDNFRFRLWAP